MKRVPQPGQLDLWSDAAAEGAPPVPSPAADEAAVPPAPMTAPSPDTRHQAPPTAPAPAPAPALAPATSPAPVMPAPMTPMATAKDAATTSPPPVPSAAPLRDAATASRGPIVAMTHPRSADVGAAPPVDPAALLADGFAQQARRWSLAQGADAATAALAARAAHALSLATSEGHVCIELDQLASDARPPDVAAWRTALRASGIVGTPAAPGACPLLLDAGDRLYLQRDFQRERRLAERIVAALRRPPHPLAAGVSPPSPSTPPGEVDAAALASAMALRGRLTIVSGGPGTGKTTAVVRLLGQLLALQPDCRIALAAPTGKAAARMSEAIRQRAADLPPHLRLRLPAAASTLHRLLGVSPAARGGPGEGFQHHAGRPLPIDLLVIDEASMLDLALAVRVLEAVPPDARIVLLGDQDQLAAVESGAVFAELSADPGLSPACLADLARACAVAPALIEPPPPRAASGLRDAVVWFQRNHRFAADSGIGRLARDIRRGDVAAALDGLAAATGDAPPLRWLRDAQPAPAAATQARLADGYAAYVAALQAHAAGQADPAAVMAAWDRYRVLCALRAGPRGVAAMNRRLTTWARARLGPAIDTDPRSPWYPGRPVMVLRNDPLLRLFNGDVGITLPRAGGGGLEVWFGDGAEGLRAVAPVRLPEHDDAWAMTVHQSQGSEFDAVGVLLPAEPHRVLSRELLYTAVTRARRQVTLAGSAAVLAAAIAAPTRRRSGLTARLQEALARAEAGDSPAVLPPGAAPP